MTSMPVILLDPKYGMEYTLSDRRDCLAYCQIVSEDFRTEKYARIDLLLDAFNNWDGMVQMWCES